MQCFAEPYVVGIIEYDKKIIIGNQMKQYLGQRLF